LRPAGSHDVGRLEPPANDRRPSVITHGPSAITHRPGLRRRDASRIIDCHVCAFVTVLSALDRPGQVFEHITPNWFASVMGTGIVAIAAATLPVHVPGLRAFAVVVWAFAAVVLAILTGAFAVHWTRHRELARSYATHPLMTHFYGAPAIALLTVGAGTLLTGADLLGPTAALVVDVVLWTTGTIIGLATSVWIPFTMITTQHDIQAVAAPAWMMPILPPMVSAATGSLLIPHVSAGQPRLTMYAACYAMFGLSLCIGMITLTMVYARLVHGGLPAVQAIPTIWITLGIIGQSITVANLLAAKGATVFLGDQSDIVMGLHAFGVIYGLLFGGFGSLIFCLATALTVHALGRGLSFSLTWWSFTFPVGTCVTGASALGVETGISVIGWLAVALYLVLLAAWVTVAAYTVRGSISGHLFLSPEQAKAAA
jgi:C4-dicarboxylate transporter/malic acid transport protein